MIDRDTGQISKDWRQRLREIEARKVIILDEEGIRNRTSKRINPNTNAFKEMLSNILPHSGESLNASEITKMLVDACNTTSLSGTVSRIEAYVLPFVLDQYCDLIILDPQVANRVKTNIDLVLERSIKRVK